MHCRARLRTHYSKSFSQSPANYSSKQSAAYPYDLFSNSEPEQLLRYGNVPRHFVRKPQCDFGWDWGPDTMPSGIWGNVR